MFEWFLSFWSESQQDFFIYITAGAHQAFYRSFLTIVGVTAVGSCLALGFGMVGAVLARARAPLFSIPGRLYMNMVRGIPDLLFFVFFPLAIILIIKVVRTWLYCAPGTPLFDGINFAGCPQSEFLDEGAGFLYWFTEADRWISGPALWLGENFERLFNLALACLAIGLIFGAFAANVIRGALDSVPAAQLEAARAYGFRERQIFWRIHMPQMWIYAWGGLTNIWVLIIKATSLLSLLGIQEAVWWTVNKLGPPQPRAFVGYVHGDWTVYYLFLLLIFYLLFTYASETGFAWGKRRLGKGMGAT